MDMGGKRLLHQTSSAHLAEGGGGEKFRCRGPISFLNSLAATWKKRKKVVEGKV